MDEPFDVAVVGAGPAGSVAAHELARRGRRVVLLDRAEFPRDKVCGDALVADSLRVLSRLGLLARTEAIGRRTRLIRGVLPDGGILELPCEFVCAPRRAFDDLLRGAAAERGAEARRADVVAIEAGPGAARVIGKEGRAVSARAVLVATGAVSPLLDLFAPGAAAAHDALAARAYFRLAGGREADRVVVSWDRSTSPGYGWLFPLPDGVVNVGCGVFLEGRRRPPPNLARMLEAFVGSPEIAALLDGAERLSPLRGAPLRCGMRRLLPARDRMLAIGEAQGATLPFSGEGIGKAMESAELAAECVDDALAKGDLSAAALASYTRALEDRLRPRYRAYETAQRWVRRPALASWLGRRARKSASLRALMSGLLDESTPPDEIFSARSVLRSYWE